MNLHLDQYWRWGASLGFVFYTPEEVAVGRYLELAEEASQRWRESQPARGMTRLASQGGSGPSGSGERKEDSAMDEGVQSHATEATKHTNDTKDCGAVGSASPTVTGGPPISGDYTLITTDDELLSALRELVPAPLLGLDLETTGLNPRADRLRLVQLATPERTVIVDAFQVDVGLLRPVLESQGTKAMHNGRFDMGSLLAQGLTVCRPWDTMLADQVMRGSRIPRGLEAVAQEYLQVALPKQLQLSDWSGELSAEQLRYAARDAAVVPLLQRAQENLARKEDLLTCIDLENGALPAVVWLEHCGAPFDTEGWRALADEALAEKLGIEDELDALARSALPEGNWPEKGVNWSSPKQVLGVLQALGLDVSSTAQDRLVAVADHPVVAKLMEHRGCCKRVGTYGIRMLGFVDATTGRIHADWYQIGADSGRMSCTRPNLQNVPRIPAYRACFAPREGRVLIKADYSQIELRFVAQVAGDARMLQAFVAREDLHSLTAREVLRKDDITPQDRQAGKAINFGLSFGMGAPRLAAYARDAFGVAMSEDEARQFRRRFFRTYSGIRRWHRTQVDGLVDVRSLSGRRRRGVVRFTE